MLQCKRTISQTIKIILKVWNKNKKKILLHEKLFSRIAYKIETLFAWTPIKNHHQDVHWAPLQVEGAGRSIINKKNVW